MEATEFRPNKYIRRIPGAVFAIADRNSYYV
jgi:hypothetical protein